MPTYKLIGTKPNETPDAAIIRCANNLVKAVLASGRSLRSYPGVGVAGLEVSFFKHVSGEIRVWDRASDLDILGKTPLKMIFMPKEPENDLTQDDACAENGGEQFD